MHLNKLHLKINHNKNVSKIIVNCILQKDCLVSLGEIYGEEIML